MLKQVRKVRAVCSPWGVHAETPPWQWPVCNPCEVTGWNRSMYGDVVTHRNNRAWNHNRWFCHSHTQVVVPPTAIVTTNALIFFPIYELLPHVWQWFSCSGMVEAADLLAFLFDCDLFSFHFFSSSSWRRWTTLSLVKAALCWQNYQTVEEMEQAWMMELLLDWLEKSEPLKWPSRWLGCI